MTVELPVFLVSTPQGHADDIPYPLEKRVDALLRELNERDAALCVMPEWGPLLAPFWDDHRRWTVLEAPNNSLKGRRPTMTATAYRHDLLAPTRVKHFPARIPGRTLTSTLTRFRCLEQTRHRVSVLGGHIPTRRDATEEKRAWMERKLDAGVRAEEALDRPTLALLDRNNGQPGPLNRGKVGAHHGPDWIYGFGVRFGEDWEIDGSRFSDHMLIGALAKIPEREAA